MTLHRFFVAPDDAVGDRFPLPASIERQVQRVLRLRDGDRLVILTGDGQAATCRLEDGACVVERRDAAGGEPTHRLTIVQALLRGDGLETVIRQGTEIGVAAFRLVVTERCVARDLSPRRLDRLRAIAREAAEQSERGAVPPIDGPGPLATELTPGRVLLAERDGATRLAVIEPPAALIVGPEGGFTPGELAAASEAGVPFAWLGPRILRAETVAIAAAAVALSRTGDFA